MPTQPSKNLDTFPNPHPDRDYIIEIECPEFTCLCPKTGQPDFASLSLEYVPDRLCVELKSLKLYGRSYRDEGHFHEDVTNRILDDLVAVLHPRYLRLRAKFNVRGGLYPRVGVVHRQDGWQAPAPPPADLPRETQELPGKEAFAAAATTAKNHAARPAHPPKPRTPVKLTEPVIPPAPAAKNNAAKPAPAPEPEITASERFRMLRRLRLPHRQSRKSAAVTFTSALISAPPVAASSPRMPTAKSRAKRARPSPPRPAKKMKSPRTRPCGGRPSAPACKICWGR